MQAVTRNGRRDVRMEEVPDPTIYEPNDTRVRITSSAIRGSDLHRYEVIGAFMAVGDVFGHEPTGVVDEEGARCTTSCPATGS